jgi:guanine deaminase
MEDRHMTERLILGQVLRLDADPAQTGPAAARHDRTGAIRVSGGKIVEIGILPGFIDAHAHYPQTAIIASWGKRLIDWLNTTPSPKRCAFPTPTMRAEIADRYLDLLLANGTTTVCSYCTIHPKASRRSSPRPRPAACGFSRARPAWTATRPTACATPRNRPMTTARRS